MQGSNQKFISRVFSLSPGHKRICGVFRAQGTCPVAANVVLFRLNKIYKLNQNVVVSECTVCYHVVAYWILCDYSFTSFWGSSHTQNIPLVTTLSTWAGGDFDAGRNMPYKGLDIGHGVRAITVIPHYAFKDLFRFRIRRHVKSRRVSVYSRSGTTPWVAWVHCSIVAW